MTSIYLLLKLSMIVLAMDFSSVTVVSLITTVLPVLGMVTGILFVGNPLLNRTPRWFGYVRSIAISLQGSQ